MIKFSLIKSIPWPPRPGHIFGLNMGLWLNKGLILLHPEVNVVSNMVIFSLLNTKQTPRHATSPFFDLE